MTQHLYPIDSFKKSLVPHGSLRGLPTFELVFSNSITPQYSFTVADIVERFEASNQSSIQLRFINYENSPDPGTYWLWEVIREIHKVGGRVHVETQGNAMPSFLSPNGNIEFADNVTLFVNERSLSEGIRPGWWALTNEIVFTPSSHQQLNELLERTCEQIVAGEAEYVVECPVFIYCRGNEDARLKAGEFAAAVELPWGGPIFVE